MAFCVRLLPVPQESEPQKRNCTGSHILYSFSKLTHCMPQHDGFGCLQGALGQVTSK